MDIRCTFDDNGNMINDGQLEYTYDAENRLILVRNVDPLAAACDVDLAFTTYGDATWFAQSAEHYNDSDAAQSGAIGASEETWLQTTVKGEGNVSFTYKLAPASEDALMFTIDDTPQITWTSGTTWNYTGNFTISDSAQHVLKWKYSKTSSGSSAGTAWVDNISWSGSAPASERPWSEIEYTYDPTPPKPFLWRGHPCEGARGHGMLGKDLPGDGSVGMLAVRLRCGNYEC